jgi:2-polyprenyl-6-methoxyphenol hydroxylase-like FAD-dependent oxidoreductase
MTETRKAKLSPQVRDALAVLIVGAGPTGLTLACELGRRSVSFCLIEAAPGQQPGSRGEGIQPRTLEVFADRISQGRGLAPAGSPMPLRSTTRVQGREDRRENPRQAGSADLKEDDRSGENGSHT